MEDGRGRVLDITKDDLIKDIAYKKKGGIKKKCRLK